MKVGDLVEMRATTARRGIIVKCRDREARKVVLWEVLMTDGRYDTIWSSDMKLIHEGR